MNPADAPMQDWRMYYNNTWMIHERYGACLVSVLQDDETGENFFKVTNTLGKNWNRINSNHLKLFFPPVGSYNVGTSAIYLGRRAQRQMRKSACYPDTYYVAWGGRPSSTRILKSVVSPVYPSVDEALPQLCDGTRRATAISRNWILAPLSKEQVSLIYKGVDVGTMTDKMRVELKSTTILPHDRLLRSLELEGVRC